MTKEEIKALKAIIERTGHAPWWDNSPYVAEAASGYIDEDEYSDSAILEQPLSEIPLSEMKLVEVHDADLLIKEYLEALRRE
jgi:hypothetical protein